MTSPHQEDRPGVACSIMPLPLLYCTPPPTEKQCSKQWESLEACRRGNDIKAISLGSFFGNDEQNALGRGEIGKGKLLPDR